MQYFTIVLICLVFFFVLKGNYKISVNEEKRSKEVDVIKKDLAEFQNYISNKINLIEKDISIINSKIALLEKPYMNSSNSYKNDALKLEKTLNDIRADLNVFQKEVGKVIQMNSKNENDLLVQNSPKPSNERLNQRKDGQKDFSESLVNKIVGRFNMASEEEKKLLTQVFTNPDNSWIKFSAIDISENTLKFMLPMLCRKFIIDGKPIIKIKDVNGIQKLIWGENIPKDINEEVITYFKKI